MEEMVTITCKRREAVRANRLNLIWTAMLIVLCLVTLVFTLAGTIIADTWFGILLVLLLGIIAYQFLHSYNWWRKQLEGK